MLEFYDIVGMAGVGCILAMFLGVQTGRMRPEQLSYSLINLLGALGILYSLLFEFNLSAVVIETVWCAISLVGVYRWWRARRG